ncbi:hypothetical protein SOASR032_30140 [Pragia fontium]|uniref:NapC/NirT cytochrome c N-terminal domain-containing protein n=1 Tax=Pragia fontium TaxID=82985 RepID=A0ABQ5LLF0_9GAMM|nr:hypothetical protein SOASR032_30140 [Pragia fontium]
MNYLVSKGTQGINDVVKVVFTDTDKIDWLSHRKLRESFVYDSGCLECHKTLLDKAQKNGFKSQQMHQHYKVLQQTENPVACVSCHVTIGHNGELRNELNKTHPEYKYKKENAE